jgi:exosortase H (IPTLxxWG-CTERM-specific)
MSEAGPDATDASETTGRAPGPPAGSDYQAPWFRFALVFSALAIGSEILYYVVALESEVFTSYLAGIARISGWFLNFSDPEIVVDKIRISSRAFSVRVAQGCDAIQVCTLLASAIIAFPLPLRAKLRGLVVGVGTLQVLNLMRVVTLFWIGEHFESVFQVSHEVLWPGFLIVSTIVIWIFWVRYESQPAPRPADAA